MSEDRTKVLTKRRAELETALGNAFVSWMPSIDGILIRDAEGYEHTLTAEMLTTL